MKIGKFEGSDLLYQDEVRGSLLIIADRVIDLIYLKYLKAAISYHKETRVETYPFARDAVREAVFNALQSAKVPVSIATKNQNVIKDVTKESKVLSLLRKDATMTTTEMAQKLSVNKRTIQREIEKLKKENRIVRKGGKRYGYWEIHE